MIFGWIFILSWDYQQLGGELVQDYVSTIQIIQKEEHSHPGAGLPISLGPPSFWKWTLHVPGVCHCTNIFGRNY